MLSAHSCGKFWRTVHVQFIHCLACTIQYLYWSLNVCIPFSWSLACSKYKSVLIQWLYWLLCSINKSIRRARLWSNSFGCLSGVSEAMRKPVNSWMDYTWTGAVDMGCPLRGSRGSNVQTWQCNTCCHTITPRATFAHAGKPDIAKYSVSWLVKSAIKRLLLVKLIQCSSKSNRARRSL